MSTLESLERSSGDYRIVWEIVYGCTRYHQHGHDGVEWQTKTRERETTHIIAPTLALARAAFDHKLPAFCDYEFVSATPLCTINYEIGVGGERYL